MHNSFFNLEVAPFSETPDTHFFYQGDSHREALSRLESSIDQGRGFIMLTGEVGTGKTLLSRQFMNKSKYAGDIVLILQPQLEGYHLIDAIADEFGVNAESPKASLSKLAHLLLDRAKEMKRSIVFIDEAQCLSFKAMETVRLLSNLECETKKLIQIILCGQPELERKLLTKHLRQINQRISVRIKLPPFSLFETEGYIKHRIEIAGGGNYIGFSLNAFQLIQKYSGGIPRLINLICSSAIDLASMKNRRYITEETIRESLLYDGILTKRKTPFSPELILGVPVL